MTIFINMILLCKIPNYTQDAYLVSVASLYAYLKHKGQSVKCIDPISDLDYEADGFNDDVGEDPISIIEKLPNIENVVEKFYSYIEEYKSKFIGFSCIYGNVYASLYFAQRIKEKYPDVKIIFGGPAILHSRGMFETSYIDFIIDGEGEQTLLELVTYVPPENITGLSYKVEVHNNKWIKNAPRAVEIELDNFPFPDYSDLEETRYYKDFHGISVPLTFSRGCPYTCNFCDVHQYSHSFRHYTIDTVFDYVKEHYDRGHTAFTVHDSIVNGNPKWLEKFCDRIIENEMKLLWTGSFRIQRQLDNIEFLRKIIKSGCHSFIFGLESGSPKILKHMGKFYDIEMTQEIFTKIHSLQEEFGEGFANINIQLIIGYPAEEEDDFQMTLDFVKKNKDKITHIISCSSFMMIPTIDLQRMITSKEFNIKYWHNAHWTSDYSTPEIRLDRMDRAEELFKEINIPYRMFFKEFLEEIIANEKTKSMTTGKWQNEIG